jgi:hypothetical protein
MIIAWAPLEFETMFLLRSSGPLAFGTIVTSVIVFGVLLTKTLAGLRCPRRQDVSSATSYFPLPGLLSLLYFTITHAFTIPSVLSEGGLVDPRWPDFMDAQSSLVAFIGVAASTILYLIALSGLILIRLCRIKH